MLSFCLQALHISCVIPQIRYLLRTFPTYGGLESMKSLFAAVLRLSALELLSMHWTYDPFEQAQGEGRRRRWYRACRMSSR
ncbi:hypothetical protein R3P38DRAFT_1191504 [Favolaschia claudopus]|uniref:Secreted protein n=1 Tax=Favolaschia claudopus TaxID=2862362 RepID=A0AAW0E4Y2_9AGAR